MSAESTASPSGWRRIVSKDLPASVVVFLVALPLSMGIALASGAPILAGLISAAVGGIVVGSLAGAPLQVSGPAAGLVVIVFTMIQTYGWKAVCALTLAAGLIQMTLGLLRVARAALVVSPAVLHGMLAGIGIQIVLAQLHVVLGDKPEASAWKNLLALPGQVRDLHGPATILGLITIAILVLWPLMPFRKKIPIPPALIAVAGVTCVSFLWDRDIPRVELPGAVWTAIHLPEMPQGNWLNLALGALTLALVASAESLLCAAATDKLHDGPRANLDKELVAQGVGNSLAGLIGGLPITGVIVRSTANIEAGGKSRFSAIFHGVWMLVFVALLGGLLTRIPLAVLAGLLVVVGTKLVNPSHIREVIKHKEWPVYFATLGGVVGINLLVGIGIGVAVALVMLLRRLTRCDIKIEQRDERWRVDVTGALTFLTVPKLTAALEKVPGGKNVDVDLEVSLIDHAALEALHAWRASYERTGGKVDIDQVHEWSRPRKDTAHAA
jgi:carbonic anhydrase